MEKREITRERMEELLRKEWDKYNNGHLGRLDTLIDFIEEHFVLKGEKKNTCYMCDWDGRELQNGDVVPICATCSQNNWVTSKEESKTNSDPCAWHKCTHGYGGNGTFHCQHCCASCNPLNHY